MALRSWIIHGIPDRPQTRKTKPFLTHSDLESQAAENYPQTGAVWTEDGNFEAAENVDEVKSLHLDENVAKYETKIK